MINRGKDSLIQNFLDMDQNAMYKKTSNTKAYARNADKYLKFCPDCKVVWEYERVGGDNTYKKILYHEDFPSLGKKRKQCIRCKK